jgi:hypothetical protein
MKTGRWFEGGNVLESKNVAIDALAKISKNSLSLRERVRRLARMP